MRAQSEIIHRPPTWAIVVAVVGLGSQAVFGAADGRWDLFDLILLVGTGLGLLRLASMRVALSGDELVIANFFSRARLSREQVAGVVPHAPEVGTLRVKLTKGDSIPIRVVPNRGPHHSRTRARIEEWLQPSIARPTGHDE